MLRPAGNALKWLFSKPGAVKGAAREMMNAGEIAFRIIPDAGFGLLTAAQTPGDIFDKAVAGGAQVVGGAGGGLLLGKLGGRNDAASNLLDMMGSVGGDFAAMPIADTIQRGKDKVMGGEGLTPWERMGKQEKEALIESAQTQVLADLGLLPAETQGFLVDPTLAANGLGG